MPKWFATFIINNDTVVNIKSKLEKFNYKRGIKMAIEVTSGAVVKKAGLVRLNSGN